MNRFERQVILQGFGTAGQGKLQKAKVLVIGAGGLGCPALLYLAAAGVGIIGIADGDIVSVSNLNRQIIYGENDVGKRKAEVASGYLQKKYSDITIESIPEFITSSNALSIIGKYDLVLDGSDNFPTRYIINDACVLLNKPLISGAIYQHEGQVAVLNVVSKNDLSANYRDIYPEPPGADEIPNCDETGVLGALPGIIGAMQAAEAIKVLSGYGTPLINKILFYDLKSPAFYETEIISNPLSKKLIPVDAAAFVQADYSIACSSVNFVNWEQALTMQQKNPGEVMLVDVRESDEQPVPEDFDYINIPFSVLQKEYHQLLLADTLLLFCQSGVRSVRAAQVLKTIFPEKIISSVKGGIMDPMSPIHHQYHET